MEKEQTFLECYLCGGHARFVIELAGEDEALREEAACEAHARGHWRRALLTAPAADVAPEPSAW